VSPNVISCFGVLVAACAAAALIASPHADGLARVVLLLAAALSIQLRLLSNLMDGMVAVEGGRRTLTGDLYNEIPDRIADVLILVGAGYAATWVSWGEALGWAAALGAMLTAYVRLLGGSLGLPQHFSGPMAKPHRMAVLTVACLASIVDTRALTIGLFLIVIGTVVTFARRTVVIAQELQAR
jgi:phosphatidylglycerophosphate synthase